MCGGMVCVMCGKGMQCLLAEVDERVTGMQVNSYNLRAVHNSTCEEIARKSW